MSAWKVSELVQSWATDDSQTFLLSRCSRKFQKHLIKTLIVSLSTILIFDFGIFLTVWHCFSSFYYNKYVYTVYVRIHLKHTCFLFPIVQCILQHGGHLTSESMTDTFWQKQQTNNCHSGHAFVYYKYQFCFCFYDFLIGFGSATVVFVFFCVFCFLQQS